MLAVDVKRPISTVAADTSFVVLATAAIPSLYRVSLAQPASAAPARAARVASRAAVGLFYVLLEDARLLLAVVICVREPSQNSAAGHRELVRRQKDTACAQSTSKVPSPLSLAMRPG